MGVKHSARQVRIGNKVFIGSHVRILKGVTIGDGCTIGQGSLVVNDLPANSLAVGIPARVVRML
jgi:maltose O-acetyltransferase